MSRLQTILQNLRNPQMAEQFLYVAEALQVVKAIVQKQQNRKTTYVSFNGGKDATVVLYLTAIAYLELGLPTQQIKVLYFDQTDPFEEVDAFRKEIQLQLGFSQIVTEKNFAKSLTNLKLELDINFIIMGSRKTDPYCQQLEILTPSDVKKGYPEFVRVNPILNWSFDRVWHFIRGVSLPYCPLYNQGYTYLGNKQNTAKNPSLCIANGQYHPAWFAEDDAECSSRALK